MKSPSRSMAANIKRGRNGSERPVSPDENANHHNRSQGRRKTKSQAASKSSRRSAEPDPPSTRKGSEKVPAVKGERWPEGGLSQADEAIVRGWAVEHGLERVARIVVALVESKEGRAFSNESEAMQWMAALLLADPNVEFTLLATEAAARIGRKSADQRHVAKRLARAFSEEWLHWLWYEKRRKPPAPPISSDDLRPSPAHELVIHRIVSMFNTDSIDLYKALLDELNEADSYKLDLIKSRKKRTIISLLSKRLKEHQTGAFTVGANRAARTLFGLIAWDLENLDKQA